MELISIPATSPGEGNHRFVVRLDEGSEVEAVLYRGDSLCISTQVGCAVRCPFCASGANGLERGLTQEELQFQLEDVLARGFAVKRITLSGVGEPLHNHDATFPFVEWARRVHDLPVSATTTGGPLPRLREWLHAPHNGLTISVHSGTEATRAKTVPKGPRLEELFDCLADEQSRMNGTRRKLATLAYLLVRGVNDSNEEVDAFIERVLALPHPSRVDLYQLNPVPTSTHEGVDRERYTEVYNRIKDHGLYVRMSSQARLETNGGCGTLVALRRSVRREGAC